MIRSSGGSWTRTWPTGSTATPIPRAGRNVSPRPTSIRPRPGPEVGQAGFTGTALYGVEGPGWPLRRDWADPRRREQMLFAARAVETQPSMLGFSLHFIAAAVKP